MIDIVETLILSIALGGFVLLINLQRGMTISLNFVRDFVEKKTLSIVYFFGTSLI